MLTFKQVVYVIWFAVFLAHVHGEKLLSEKTPFASTRTENYEPKQRTPGTRTRDISAASLPLYLMTVNRLSNSSSTITKIHEPAVATGPGVLSETEFSYGGYGGGYRSSGVNGSGDSPAVATGPGVPSVTGSRKFSYGSKLLQNAQGRGSGGPRSREVTGSGDSPAVATGPGIPSVTGSRSLELLDNRTNELSQPELLYRRLVIRCNCGGPYGRRSIPMFVAQPDTNETGGLRTTRCTCGGPYGRRSISGSQLHFRGKNGGRTTLAATTDELEIKGTSGSSRYVGAKASSLQSPKPGSRYPVSGGTLTHGDQENTL